MCGWGQSRGLGSRFARSSAFIATHLEEGLAVPGNALVDVGGGVREAVSLSGLAAEDAVEVGADLVGAAGLGGVALSATGLEDAGTLANVSCEGVSYCIAVVVGSASGRGLS